MKIKSLLIAAFIFVAGCISTLKAQHTVGAFVGYGMGSSRIYPKQETRGTWGMYNVGLSWRHYGKQRVVGGFGVDLEFLQSAYSYAPYASITENESDYRWYTRKVNSIMVPVVWQPHFYIKKKIRVYFEAAATFSYRFGGSYENEVALDSGKEDWKGDYEYKTARDNRWGYGLAGGAGVSVLIKQWEIGARVRYYFGFGDILRNRNKYANNANDGSENPFWGTPLRSPLDNLSVALTVAFRFNKEGFDVWKLPRKKREKRDESFNYQQ